MIIVKMTFQILSSVTHQKEVTEQIRHIKDNKVSYPELIPSRFLEHYTVRFSFIGKLLQVINNPCEFY